jgi:hypothetical protein
MDPFTNCHRKRVYATRAEAAANAAGTRPARDGTRPVAYKCKTCGRWHVGRRGGRRGS